ncbi:hypothetical protein ASN86_00653 [Streptococcus parauberis]|nr:hypothetical protein ASN86_00653 [Streptococcus parauberis]
MNIYSYIFNSLRQLKKTSRDFFTIDDEEKITKFITRIKAEMSARKKALSRYNVASAKLYRQVSGEVMPQIILMIDNYEGLREAQNLASLDATFQSISRDGSALGISLVLSAGRMAALRSSLIANLKERLVLKLTDDSETRTLLGRHQHVMDDIPGRGLIKRDEIEVIQVALPTEGTETYDIISNIQAESDAMNEAWTGSRPKAIPMLPEALSFDEFKTYDSVEVASQNNMFSFGLSVKKILDNAIPLNRLKQVMFTSDNPEHLNNVTRFLVKSSQFITNASLHFVDGIGDYDDLSTKVSHYYRNKNDIVEFLEKIITEITYVKILILWNHGLLSFRI